MKRDRVSVVLRLTSGPDVLDVGCAGGRRPVDARQWLHARLRERFESVWGIDKTERALRELESVGWTNLHVASAENFSLPRKFDTIVAGELIEHLSNPGAFLDRAVEHLKPGGRIVLTTPYVFGIHHLLYAWAKFPYTCSNDDHSQWLCPATLQTLAARAGLDVYQWELVDAYRGHVKGITRLFYFLMRTCGKALPKRVRATTMVVALTLRTTAAPD